MPEEVARRDGRRKDERRQELVAMYGDVLGKVLSVPGIDRIDEESDGGGRNEGQQDEEVGDAVGDDQLLDDCLPARQPVDADALDVLLDLVDLDSSVRTHVEEQAAGHDDEKLPVEFCRQHGVSIRRATAESQLEGIFARKEQEDDGREDAERHDGDVDEVGPELVLKAERIFEHEDEEVPD